MSTDWEKFGRGWKGAPDEPLPQRSPDAEEARRLDLPPTIRPVAGAEQKAVYDPAMSHHRNAVRAGEPRFPSRDREERWNAARRTAVDHVLAAVSESRWADDLVLRGSVLLRAWYGALAREPGDVDFVVVPQGRQVAERRTRQMRDGIVQAAEDMSWRDVNGEVRVAAAGAVEADIWAYDRVPGRRLVLPWEAEGLPGGTVQLDFAFNEHLPVVPEVTLVPRPGGGEPLPLNAAAPGLSLAWKIFWLLTDEDVQGKDLYDAWLLAEHTRLDHDVLDELFRAHDTGRRGAVAAAIGGLDVFAAAFREEVPGAAGVAGDYVRMLAARIGNGAGP